MADELVRPELRDKQLEVTIDQRNLEAVCLVFHSVSIQSP
jgi:hypothetical protein